MRLTDKDNISIEYVREILNKATPEELFDIYILVREKEFEELQKGTRSDSTIEMIRIITREFSNRIKNPEYTVEAIRRIFSYIKSQEDEKKMETYERCFYQDLYRRIPKQVQKQTLDIILQGLSTSSMDSLYYLRRAINPEVCLSNYMKILYSLKSNPNYDDIEKIMVGNVEHDEQGNVIFKDEEIMNLLLGFTISPTATAEERFVQEDIIDNIVNNIPLINDNIESIKLHLIYLKQARESSGLKFKLTAKEIMIATMDSFGSRQTSPDLEELFSIPGAEELIRRDTKFITRINSVYDRANMVASEMTSDVKKFPNFSFCDTINGIKFDFKVFGPQDKEAMLLGYKTDCCFRPAGLADCKGQNPGDSLYEYCLTSPYGGVCMVETTLPNGESFCHMGTPILVNGNMGLFHSFETARHPLPYKTDINILLEKAAMAWLKKESDFGSDLRAVFMTTLHPERFDLEDKLLIPDIFVPYFGEEMQKYKGMYSNINGNERGHLLLSANIDGRIIAGKELVDFFRDECKDNIVTLIQRIGLREGPRVQNYEYEKAKFSGKIRIDNPEMIDSIYPDYIDFTDKNSELFEAFSKFHLAKRTKYKGNNDISLDSVREQITRLLKKTYPDFEMAEDAISDKEIFELEKRLYAELQDIIDCEDVRKFAKRLGISEKVEESIVKTVEAEDSGRDKTFGEEYTLSQKRSIGRMIGSLKKLGINGDFLSKLQKGEYVDVQVIRDYASANGILLDEAVAYEYEKAFSDDSRKKAQRQEGEEQYKKQHTDDKVRARLGNQDDYRTAMIKYMLEHRLIEFNIARSITPSEAFELVKAKIASEIKKKEKIQQIAHSISGIEDVDFDEFYYGRDWYLGVKGKTPQIGYRPDLTESKKKEVLSELAKLKKELEKQKAQETPEK